MKLKSRVEDDIVILEPEGALVDSSSLKPSKEIIEGFLERGFKKFIYDVKDVTQLTSTGLGIILSAITAVKTGGGEMVLANVSSKIQSYLSIAKLVEIASGFDTLEDAKAHFSKTS